jgi:hypothetical protein
VESAITVGLKIKGLSREKRLIFLPAVKIMIEITYSLKLKAGSSLVKKSRQRVMESAAAIFILT